MLSINTACVVYTGKCKRCVVAGINTRGALRKLHADYKMCLELHDYFQQINKRLANVTALLIIAVLLRMVNVMLHGNALVICDSIFGF